ncbi:hypothetical protein LF1_41950 [Rubripirellula obstinata]|uniref:Nucleotidyltransferase n=1 Tax=Rubripirellula obstinata TaxID=406547 RepID=A0A5B1CPT0_9BACT|nr:hypothetical protein [Rubripirellula obstinata]KAA1261640.1 hypothetical protein LF1_41950 [Rubripirellula obstinata]
MTRILDAAKRADLFFKNQSPIHEAMRRLNKTLGEMEIPFAVAGAMAANAHGHRRTTADVDILIRQEDLDRFKAAFIGRGWTDIFEGSKNFRDAVVDVKIVAWIVDQFPGDGLEKPVAFPAPETVAETGEDGVPVISLKTLIELKIASGMTAVHRPRDLDDVIQLIKVNKLSKDFGSQLNPYVADKFAELWAAAQVVEEY